MTKEKMMSKKNLPPEVARLQPTQPLESNLSALARDPAAAIEAFGAEWAGWCAASALDALAHLSASAAGQGEAVACVPDLPGLVKYLRHEAAMEDMLDDRREWLLKWADALDPPKPTLTECPHATPFVYCQTCVVNPCPLGLGGSK